MARLLSVPHMASTISCIVSLEVEMSLDLDPKYKQNPDGKGASHLLEEA